jgi:hypothetical protein
LADVSLTSYTASVPPRHDRSAWQSRSLLAAALVAVAVAIAAVAGAVRRRGRAHTAIVQL